MIKIKGTEKELEEMIHSWLPNSGFPAVRDMVSAQTDGLLYSLNGLRFEVEVEPEPEMHVYGPAGDYGVVGTPTTLWTHDNYCLHVGDIVIIEYDEGDIHWVEARPVLVGTNKCDVKVPFVAGFFGYFSPTDQSSIHNVQLKLAKSYKEILAGTRIGNLTYVKS